MDTSQHTINTLFQQLGLPSSDREIEQFVSKHKPLAKDIHLSEATFWTGPQAAFIKEAISDDSDWAAIVDQLDAQLRH